MNPDRWHRVEDLFHEASQRQPEERHDFLIATCNGDDALRREVESLIEQQDDAAGFIETSALAQAARLLAPEAAGFLAGRTFGVYRIDALIGSGGIGEVYRARDTRLKRDVAIKILPDEFSRDSVKVSRLQREAEVLASLNHPHVAAIYDLQEAEGSCFLVLELVEGETLAERMMRGPLTIDEALELASEICFALEGAHDSGVVHCDLKPANVKVRPDGRLKVLDFGLAKAVESASGSDTPGASVAPVSWIIGTVAYMSPEQAKGRPVDRRTDIFAFGSIFFEMLCGRRPFEGEGISETLTNLTEREPDWSLLPQSVPARVRELLRLCLEKDLTKRLRDARDIRIGIEQVKKNPAESPDAAASGFLPRVLSRWLAVFALIAVLVLGLAYRDMRPSAPAREMRLEIATPPAGDLVSMALSPDGSKVVFVATAEGEERLWVRSLDSTAAKPLSGTEGAAYPFWSPDGHSIGFFAGGKLKRIDAEGGAPQIIASAPAPRGGTWNRAGVILYAPSVASGLYRVADTGGETIPVTHVDAVQQLSHRAPVFLPDGQHFLFYVHGIADMQGVHVASLDGSMGRKLLDADSGAVVADDHVLFLRQGTLFAQTIDLKTFEVKNEPTVVAEQIAVDLNIPAVSASSAGTIAYRAVAGATHQFVRFDRSGKELDRYGDPDTSNALGPSLSPDGKRLAFSRTVNGNSDVWLLELDRSMLTRFTFDPASDNNPVWSPDGNSIAWSSNRKGFSDIYRKDANGAGSETLLLSSGNGKFPTDWSPDGRFILFRETDPKVGYDLWALPLSGDRKPFPVVQTNFDERDGQFSPDGKWIAFQSNESDRFEIYVQAFPHATAKTQISSGGGGQVRWRSDGKEIFFISVDGRLMAARIRLDSQHETVEAGTPVPLFRTRIAGRAVFGNNRQQYTVSSDGQHFVIDTASDDVETSPITLILNWRSK